MKQLRQVGMCVCMLMVAGVVQATDVVVAPPANGATCPDRLDGYYASIGANPCYYHPVGEFSDAYKFVVTDPLAPYTFDVSGYSARFTVASGRAHPTYSWDLRITNATVIDLTTGQIAAQLTNTPYQAYPPCPAPLQSIRCSPHPSDRWTGTFTFPTGQYALTVVGFEGGNRVFAYPWSIQVPVPPVQLPLTGSVLTGVMTCDAVFVCTMVPTDVSVVRSVTLDFTNAAITVVPAVDPVYGGVITAFPTTWIVDDTGTIYTIGGEGSVTSADGSTMVVVDFLFTYTVDSLTGLPVMTNWVITLT